VDLITPNAIIEIGQSNSGLFGQVGLRIKDISINPGGARAVIAYAPNLIGQTARNINAAGGIATNSIEELLGALRQ
jgi:hypothetical protein